jgi:putative transposase
VWRRLCQTPSLGKQALVTSASTTHDRWNAESTAAIAAGLSKYDSPLYFVTFNTDRRQKLLANARVHSRLIELAKLGEQRGIALGRYVIMPDHVHLFVRGGIDFVLIQWTRMLKRRLSKAISASAPHWQKGFFDHLIRHSESYLEKWEYVRQNPVRAGLVNDPDKWPWQGEIARLEALR